MDRRQRPIAARGRLAAALLALALTGCSNVNYILAVSWGTPVPIPAPAPSAAVAASSVGATALGGLIAVGFLGAVFNSTALTSALYSPYMDPDRRVVEVDCSQPIEDWSSNIRCR